MKKEDADQLIRCVKECWWRGVIVLSVPTALIAWAIWGWPLSVTLESSAADWLQVFGVLFGVVVAVAVPIWQRHKNIEAITDEAKVVKRSVVSAMLTATDSIALLMDAYSESEGASRSGEEVLTTYPRLFSAWHDGLGLINPLEAGLPTLLVPFLELRYSALQLAEINDHFNVEGQAPLSLDEKLNIMRGELYGIRESLKAAVDEHDLCIYVTPWRLPENVSVVNNSSHSLEAV